DQREGVVHRRAVLDLHWGADGVHAAASPVDAEGQRRPGIRVRAGNAGGEQQAPGLALSRVADGMECSAALKLNTQAHLPLEEERDAPLGLNGKRDQVIQRARLVCERVGEAGPIEAGAVLDDGHLKYVTACAGINPEIGQRYAAEAII